MPLSPVAGEPHPTDPLFHTLLAGLVVEVSKLRESVERELSRRPTRQQTRSARSLAVAAVVAGVLLGAQFYNRAAEVCGPGHKAQQAVTAVIEKRIHSVADLRRASGYVTPEPGCDIGFPLESHTPADRWPTRGNAEGMVIYGAVFMWMGIVVWWVKQQAESENEANEQTKAESEKE